MSLVTRRSLNAGMLGVVAVRASTGTAAPSTPEQELARFGRYVGTWPLSGAARAQDIVLFNNRYFFCLADYSPNAGSKPPDDDYAHWEHLPIFREKLLYDDQFSRAPANSEGGALAGMSGKRLARAT